MDTLCDFCGAQSALVYCSVDDARLCLVCDLYVHSANALSLRHFRAVLCGRCHCQPATFCYADDRLSLCEHCDFAAGDAARCRFPVSSYSGCLSPTELSTIFCTASGYFSGVGPEAAAGDENFAGCAESAIAGFLEPTWMAFSSSFVTPELGSVLPSGEEQDQFLPQDLKLPMAEASVDNDFVAPIPPDVTGKIDLSLSPSSINEESSAADFQDCGILPMTIAGVLPNTNSKSSGRQGRSEAMMRYLEKKKNRLFGKKIRYASRKERADTRKRMKGRFVKIGEAYDHDTLVTMSS